MFCDKPFRNKPLEDYSTLHRGPRQGLVTEGPRQRFVKEREELRDNMGFDPQPSWWVGHKWLLRSQCPHLGPLLTSNLRRAFVLEPYRLRIGVLAHQKLPCKSRALSMVGSEYKALRRSLRHMQQTGIRTHILGFVYFFGD